jgi:hypothetical protein
MKSPISWIVRSALFLIAALLPMLLLAGWQADAGAGLSALPQRVHAGVLMLGGIAGLLGLICWVVRSDGATGREAAHCREHTASSRADLALAESDLLLGRLGAVAPASHPEVQLALIRAELGQLQRQSAVDDPLLAARMELLCARVDRVSLAVQGRNWTLDPG